MPRTTFQFQFDDGSTVTLEHRPPEGIGPTVLLDATITPSGTMLRFVALPSSISTGSVVDVPTIEEAAQRITSEALALARAA